jgi:hypothetical protein
MIVAIQFSKSLSTTVTASASEAIKRRLIRAVIPGRAKREPGN